MSHITTETNVAKRIKSSFKITIAADDLEELVRLHNLQYHVDAGAMEVVLELSSPLLDETITIPLKFK